MSHVDHVGDLVREFLVFRGFATTTKAFDAEFPKDRFE